MATCSTRPRGTHVRGFGLSRPGSRLRGIAMPGSGAEKAGATRTNELLSVASRLQSWTAARNLRGRPTQVTNCLCVGTTPTRNGARMTGPAGQHPGASDATRYVLIPGAGASRQADITELILADHRRIRRLCRALYDTAR